MAPSPVSLSDGVVTLRAWTPSEASFLAEASREPAIERYNGPSPGSLADAAAVIEGFNVSWGQFRISGVPSGVAFAIVDAATGEPVGMCSVDNWSTTDVAQFRYWLAADARGRGFATRAARLMTGWLFKLGAARVFVTILSENVASAAVARRAGFTYEGTLLAHSVWQGRRRDVDVFAALADEWVHPNVPQAGGGTGRCARPGRRNGSGAWSAVAMQGGGSSRNADHAFLHANG